MHILIKCIWDGAQDCRFLTSSQEMPVLLVSEPYFEEQAPTSTSVGNRIPKSVFTFGPQRKASVEIFWPTPSGLP